MSKIVELREKRAKIWEDAKAFLDKNRNENGIMSAENTAIYEKMEKDIVDLGKEIERQQRMDEIEREMNAPVSRPITQKPDNAAGSDKKGRTNDAYVTAFWNQMRNVSSPEIRNALSEGIDADGGFLVPDTFENSLVKAVDEAVVIRSLAKTKTLGAGNHQIPVVATRAAASWVSENAAIPESQDTFGQKQLNAHKLCALIKVSEELVNDSAFDLEQHFRTEFAYKMALAEEDAFINGNGNGKPYGLLHDTEGGEIGITTAAATAITADELINLYHSLRGGYRKNAVWIMNDATVNAIRLLKDDNGQYIWQPGLKENSTDTILGKPVYTSASVPVIGAGNKTVLFGDLKNYWIGDRAGITFRRLNELYAANGQVGFMATKRLDARLVIPEAVKILQQKA